MSQFFSLVYFPLCRLFYCFLLDLSIALFLLFFSVIILRFGGYTNLQLYIMTFYLTLLNQYVRFLNQKLINDLLQQSLLAMMRLNLLRNLNI